MGATRVLIFSELSQKVSPLSNLIIVFIVLLESPLNSLTSDNDKKPSSTG